MTLLHGLRTLQDLDLENQRVFVRADLDAPVDRSGHVLDSSRIEAAVATLRALLDRGARVIVGSRFGEYKSGPGSTGTTSKAPSIEPAAAKLSELLGVDVVLPDGCTGDSVKKVVGGLSDRQVCVLENLATESDLGAGQEAFARQLMGYCDMYIADSVRSLSLESATTTILPRLLETRLASPTLMGELAAIERILSAGGGPRLLIWGGATLSGRIDLLMRLLPRSQKLFLVGVAANTVLAAQAGNSMGRSTVEERYLAGARTLAEQAGDKLDLPADLVVATGPKQEPAEPVSAGRVPEALQALDLGPKTRRALAEAISSAGSVLWCGSAGFHQGEAFRAGTRALVQALASSSAFTMVAGDDSVGAARIVSPESLSSIDCVATGGHATLSLLAESKLPGLEALRGNHHE